jgi:hypothetical protein
MKKLLLIAICYILSGCSSLETMTVGQIGCPSSELKIIDKEWHVGGDWTWTAECRGKRFVCANNQAGYSTQTACKEELTASK